MVNCLQLIVCLALVCENVAFSLTRPTMRTRMTLSAADAQAEADAIDLAEYFEPLVVEEVKPKADDSQDFFNRAGPWDDKNLNTLLTANYAWRKRMVLEQPTFFEEIKRGHAPKILWIGCSDARVPANEIIGQPPGALFVHRNVANMVVNTDFNVMSVIQYAVDYLQVKHIIVCGHYDCGGVKAALTQVDHKAPLENWLRNIRDTYRLHKDELNGIEDITARQRRAVELNVVEQVNFSPSGRSLSALQSLVYF